MAAGQQETVGIDRISHLEDGVLNHILSFLEQSDIRNTSLLSRRWKHLFNKSPIIDMNESSCLIKCHQKYNEKSMYEAKCREVFLESLRLTLQNHDMEYLQKLKLSIFLDRDDELDSVITQLLDSALSSEADLDLELLYLVTVPLEETYYVLPGLLFSRGSCLVSLSLQGCIFNTNGSINLPSLKTFKLEEAYIVSEEKLADLISGLPSIETMHFSHVKDLTVFRVLNSKLKFLKVHCCASIIRLEMDAPLLQTLEYTGSAVLYQLYRLPGDDKSVEFNFTARTDPEVNASNVDIVRKVISMD